MNNAPKSFEGVVKNIQLIDLIQMCCLSCANMAIRVQKDSQEGTLFVRNGKIVHAVCEDSTGEDAFYQILAWESGRFEALDTNPVPETTIEKDWTLLLMEAALMADEQAAANDQSADTGNKIQPCPGRDKPRVLIVDDSAMMCRILKDILGADEDINVVGTAKNGEDALKKIEELNPDLITLDVNMPVMDGSTALKHIMIGNPRPVVIISSICFRSQTNIIDFLSLGAVEFIAKPARNKDMAKQRQHLIEIVKLSAKAKINNFQRAKAPRLFPKKGAKSGGRNPCDLMVICNSGAGGYAELIKVISILPEDLNACLVVLQTMSYEFVSPFSDYLNKTCNLIVQPLHGKAQVVGGLCYIGINGLPLRLDLKEDKYFLLSDNDTLQPEKGHSSFDLFLHSVADEFSGRVLVALLSGADVGNLDGLRSVKRKNGQVIAQQLTSCMVPYSLERTIQAGLVESEASPVEIAGRIVQYAGRD